MCPKVQSSVNHFGIFCLPIIVCPFCDCWHLCNHRCIVAPRPLLHSLSPARIANAFHAVLQVQEHFEVAARKNRDNGLGKEERERNEAVEDQGCKFAQLQIQRNRRFPSRNGHEQ